MGHAAEIQAVGCHSRRRSAQGKEITQAQTESKSNFYRSCLTPLVQAIISREPKLPKLLLDHGALPNYAPKGCDKPLMTAADEGNLPATQILIARGAIVDQRSSRGGDTPLLEAAGTAQGIAVLQELIKAGADIHAVDDCGENALMAAAQNHNLEAVQLLLKFGLDPCAHDKKGNTTLDYLGSNLNESEEEKSLFQFFQKACSKK